MLYMFQCDQAIQERSSAALQYTLTGYWGEPAVAKDAESVTC